MEIRSIDELETVDVEDETDDVGGADGGHTGDGRSGPSGWVEAEAVVSGKEGEGMKA